MRKIGYVLATLATVGCFFAQTPAKPILDSNWSRALPLSPQLGSAAPACADPHGKGQISTDTHFSVEIFRRPIRKSAFSASSVRQPSIRVEKLAPRVRFPVR